MCVSVPSMAIVSSILIGSQNGQNIQSIVIFLILLSLLPLPTSAPVGSPYIVSFNFVYIINFRFIPVLIDNMKHVCNTSLLRFFVYYTLPRIRRMHILSHSPIILTLSNNGDPQAQEDHAGVHSKNSACGLSAIPRKSPCCSKCKGRCHARTCV